MTSQEPVLVLKGVSRIFPSGDNEIRALDDVTLTVYPGEFLAVMGQSGSGKSTLMNVIGCLDKPTSGSYAVRGREVSGLSRDELAALRRETFGFVFQRYNLLPTVTALENVEIPAIYAGTGKAERFSRAKKLLENLGIGDRMSHRPPQLSGGQQQRVAIARALMNDPPVILADEPTGALDSKSGAEVMTLLKELNAAGRTILLITHDRNVAENASRVVHLADGKITHEDTLPLAEKGEESSSLHPLPSGERGVEGASIELLSSASEAVSMAFRALRVNIFRTALTLLGIIIGVASVVAMLAIGNGSKQKILDQISAMGTNLLYIQPGAPGIRGDDDPVTLTLEDAEAVREIGNVAVVVPARTGRATMRYGNIDYASSAQSVGPGLPFVRDWPVADGYFFNDRDIKTRAAVVVLGQTVKDILFPDGSSPVGRYMLIRNIPFKIIGVMTPKGASAHGGDQDNVVFIPVTTGIARLFGMNFLSNLTIRVENLDQIDATQDAITALLVKRHHTEDFRIRNMESIIATVTETQNTLTLLLGTIAAISLLVGGIGVMNIMLVSVTERTREIGIRMAAGARMRDIMLQFNIEAVVVCAVGGVLGVLAGFAAGTAAGSFGMKAVFSAGPALLAFASAFATGVIFGYLPARKAARLDPVTALASE
ncbi:MAG: MacB family efflux pump subunit [Pseudomonadota bacterium]